MLSKNIVRSVQDMETAEKIKPILKIGDKIYDMKDPEQKKNAGMELRTALNGSIVNDINFRTLMSEVCCYADERFYLKVQILMSFTIKKLCRYIQRSGYRRIQGLEALY